MKNDIIAKKYLKQLIYYNLYFNKYEVDVSNFYEKQKNINQYLNLKLGTVILFKDFPLIDIKNDENKVDFKEHYFVVIGIENNYVYLAYTTTKIDKFKNSRYKNNNYIIFNSKKLNKKFLITIRKIFIIKKDFIINDILNNHSLILKDLTSIGIFYLKKLILNSNLYNLNFKKIISKKFKIKRNKYMYDINTYVDIKPRTIEEKKELLFLFNSEESPVKLINI